MTAQNIYLDFQFENSCFPLQGVVITHFVILL